MSLISRQRGAALITSLITIVIVAGIALLMFNRTMAEMGHSRDNVAITQTVMLARGGANVGGVYLQGLKDDVQDVVETAGNTNTPWTFGANGTADAPEATSVAGAMKTVARSLQTEVDRALCGKNYAPVGSSATVTVRVHFVNTACAATSSVPLPSKTTLPDGRFVDGDQRGSPDSTQIYAVPFVMVAEARQGDYKRNIVLQGEYRFNIGSSSFSRYAYFANERRVNGRPVYFVDGEMIDGPVHSNEYLRYDGSPWFGGEVTVAGCEDPTLTSCGPRQRPGDVFNGGDFVNAPDISTYCATPGRCPTFVGTTDWNASYIPLPTSNSFQKDEAENSGLKFSNTIKDLELSVMTVGGDTYQVMKFELCSNPVPADPNDLTCTTTTPPTIREFRFKEPFVNKKGWALEENVGGTWQKYMNGATQYHFKGVLFTDGGIANLGGPVRTDSTDPDSAPPAIASFAQFTVAATGKVLVTRDLKYETPTCSSAAQWNGGNVVRAVCNETTTKNVLGVYAQKGDLLFGTGNSSTLPELTAHGAFMSSEGRVGVNNWNKVVNTKTSLNITGGLIGNVVAGFAWSSGGYRRSVTYDPRMGTGTVPPFFPTTGQDDEVKSVFYFSYGQREQVY